MSRERAVLAVFADPHVAANAVRALRAGGHGDVRAATPAPFPDLIEALERPPSGIDAVTLSAAVLGVLAGFALCIATSLDWPLVTRAMPIVSIPPFVIIAFEIAVLVGATVNFAALTVVAWVGRRQRGFPADARFSGDRIGVLVVGGDLGGARGVLERSGAEEVSDVP